MLLVDDLVATGGTLEVTIAVLSSLCAQHLSSRSKSACASSWFYERMRILLVFLMCCFSHCSTIFFLFSVFFSPVICSVHTDCPCGAHCTV